jgi:hypothetical protein
MLLFMQRQALGLKANGYFGLLLTLETAFFMRCFSGRLDPSAFNRLFFTKNRRQEAFFSAFPSLFSTSGGSHHLKNISKIAVEVCCW